MASQLYNAHSSPKARALLALVSLFSLVLAGCAGSPSTLAPASPEASHVTNLFWLVIGVAAVIFIVVEGLLVFALLRFRSKPGAAEPRQVHGNLRLEIAWTIAPALVLVGIFWAMVQTMEAVTQPQADPLRVRVVGHQWWWQIQYPELGVTTATDLHVPAGRPVEVELIAADVIHSFWAPELFGKIDVLPDHPTLARFTANKAGVYRGQCAEFCGVQHANMGFLVVAETPDQFEEWAERMQTPAATAAGQTSRGAQAFGICMGCHTVEGTQAQGKIGPDLTHVGSRRTIGALALDNTRGNMASWLSDPQAIKPGSKMPNLGLSQEAIQSLASFLEDLK